MNLNEHHPEVNASSLFFEMTWKAYGVSMVLDCFHEPRNRRIWAELLVTNKAGEYLLSDSLTINSKSSRKGVLSGLKRLDGPDVEPDDQIPWELMLEQLCHTAKLHRRKGEEVQEVGDQPVGDGPRWQLWPIIPMGEPAMIFGLGDSYKSLVAQAWSVSVQYGVSGFGVRPVRGNVLWLDWESSAQEMNRRLKGLQGMFGLSEPPVLRFQMRYRPLIDNIERVAKYCIDHDISLVVIDNVGAAVRGSAIDDDAARDFMNAVRELKTSTLLIAHQPKNLERGRRPTPFGSTFWENRSRNVFHFVKAQEPGGDTDLVALRHTKSNVGRRLRPMAYRVHWNDDTGVISIKRDDEALHESAELAKTLTLTQQIAGLLRQGRRGSMLVADIAEVLESTPVRVRVCLNRNKKQFVKVGKEWGLAYHA